ncbi:MAG: hypothetical protein JW863_08030 [Chitinispirillaceae bacterium]|nr:hypothetical protein [Chitinispirillaceae bacterium]
MMFFKLFRVLLLTTFFNTGLFALSGTGGVPLGGMGTGYVVFDGQKIRVSGTMPPAGANHALSNAAETQISSSGFSIFAGGTAKTQVKATTEDAKCPVQRADFGAIGNVKFTLNAFGPYWPGEGDVKYQLATSPLAMFDVTAENTGTAAVDVAVAMAFDNGGKVETGNKAISYSSKYLAVDCDGASATFSAGGTGSFSTDGTLSNSDGNSVAAKCSVGAGSKVHFKFVLAWYASYDSEGYYYENFYTNAKQAAEFGIQHFDSVRVGITKLVDRTMASNFPEWYKDRLLNNTYPLIHNSVCAKDGRTAFWEGCYGIIGTIDQGQHAAVFYSFNWPQVQWQELQYWGRQQKSSGQVHHDFNQGQLSFTANSTANNRHLKAWDDKTHADYWWFSNTDTWADLNCMFIFKAYELMLATGDIEQLKENYTYLKKAMDRLVSQCGSDGIPLKSHSTYDRCNGAADATGSNCSLTPEYNGGLTVATFRAFAEIAKVCGETATATTFTDHATKAQQAFKAKYGNSNDFGVNASVPNSGRFPEGHIAGYSWANYLCLEPIMDESFITKTCEKMRSKQKTGGVRANGEWIFYCVDHYGGSEIAINRPDDALFIHQQDYDYYYKQVPNQVLWQSLQESSGNRGHDSYMTAPTVWHSYFQFCGYMIDNANNRLWIRPRIPTEMKGKITSALLLNPKAMGTLDYDENGDAASGLKQTMTVKYDAPVTIKEIMLKNNTGTTTPFVLVAGSPNPTIKAEGVAPEQNIRVTLAAPIQIGPEGVKIDVYDKPVAAWKIENRSTIQPLALQSFRLVTGAPVHYSVDVAGEVTIELLTLNGAKIGTIMQENLSAGNHTFQWNGKTLDGKVVGSTLAILRLTSESSAVSKTVFAGK